MTGRDAPDPPSGAQPAAGPRASAAARVTAAQSGSGIPAAARGRAVNSRTCSTPWCSSMDSPEATAPPAAREDLRDYFRLSPAQARPAIAALVATPEAWERRPVFLYGFDDLTPEQLDLLRALLDAALSSPSQRGVVVDDRMVTSDPAILAIGECIDVRSAMSWVSTSVSNGLNDPWYAV